MGYIVLAPEMRGRGVGQQMVSMAVTYAVELLGMKRVTLKVFDCNPGAKHCYEKVGFREEEYRKEDFPYREEMWGNSLMAYNRRRPGSPCRSVCEIHFPTRSAGALTSCP